MSYQIIVSKLKINAPIGIYPEERKVKNNILVDIIVELDRAIKDDYFKNTLDYVLLCEIAKKVLKEEHQTLEFACCKIWETIKSIAIDANFIEIRLKKIQPMIPFDLQYVEVIKKF